MSGMDECPLFASKECELQCTRRLLTRLARLSRLRPLRSDVKPENLLCSRRDGFDRVKLADFGSAMVLPPEGCAAVDPVAQGTTLYSPPEVLAGKTYSYAADMWASGITTYVLLSGNFPFGSTADAIGSSASFEGEAWVGASRAREFISSLLLHEPTRRPTALQARHHPWLLSRPRVHAACEGTTQGWLSGVSACTQDGPTQGTASLPAYLVPLPQHHHQPPAQPPSPMFTPAVLPTLSTGVALGLPPPFPLVAAPSHDFECAPPVAAGSASSATSTAATSISPSPPPTDRVSPRTPPSHVPTSESPVKRGRPPTHAPVREEAHAFCGAPSEGGGELPSLNGSQSLLPPPPPAKKRRCLRSPWRSPMVPEAWPCALELKTALEPFSDEHPPAACCPRLLAGVLPSPLYVLDNHAHALLPPAGEGGRVAAS